MPLILPARTLDSGYEIDNSLRFNSGDSADLRFTPSSAGTEETFTISAWIKKSMVGASNGQDCYLFSSQADSNNRTVMGVFGSSGTQGIFFENKVSGTSSYVDSAATFRDPSAWMHCVWAIDTTQSTNTNRVKLYVNGSQISSFDSTSYLSQNTVTQWSRAQVNYIGSRAGGNYYDGYLSDVHVIDGQQLAPTEFGETNDNGVWIPKQYTGSYGTNGYKLEFKQTGTSANSSGMGADTSGNDNHFSVNNLTATDQTTDTPTNNFATMNSVHVSSHGSSTLPTFSEGNLKIAMSDGSSTSSSIAPSSGKWYVEYKQSENTADNQGYPIVGISATLGGTAGDVIGFRTPSGTNYRGQLGTSSIDNAFLSARQAGDIFGFYIDLDNSTLIIHKNGSTYMNTGYTGGLDWSGGLTTTNSQTGFFHFYVQSNTANAFTDEVNFGNPSFSISSGNADANGFGNFEYSPTLSGTNYYALCTKNLAEYG